MRYAASLFPIGLLAGTTAFTQAPASPPAANAITAIRAGRLLDPEAARILTNQIILIDTTRIREVGPSGMA